MRAERRVSAPERMPGAGSSESGVCCKHRAVFHASLDSRGVNSIAPFG